MQLLAYALWLGITKILDENKPVKEEHKVLLESRSMVHYWFSYGGHGYHMTWQILLCFFLEKYQ